MTQEPLDSLVMVLVWLTLIVLHKKRKPALRYDQDFCVKMVYQTLTVKRNSKNLKLTI
jgi:hypothetical protein